MWKIIVLANFGKFGCKGFENFFQKGKKGKFLASLWVSTSKDLRSFTYLSSWLEKCDISLICYISRLLLLMHVSLCLLFI